MLPAESFNTILVSEFLPVQRHWISPNITKKILVYKERRKASLSGVYLLNFGKEFFLAENWNPQFPCFSLLRTSILANYHKTGLLGDGACNLTTE